MLKTNTLFKAAMSELIHLFGKEYLKANYEGTCQTSGFLNNQTYQLFVGIKDTKELPNRKATNKGWVVYARILLDANTGKTIKTEYVLE